jgi:hypothetical protein
MLSDERGGVLQALCTLKGVGRVYRLAFCLFVYIQCVIWHTAESIDSTIIALMKTSHVSQKLDLSD